MWSILITLIFVQNVGAVVETTLQNPLCGKTRELVDLQRNNMQKRYKDGIDTRRLYKFEDEYLSTLNLTQIRSIDELRQFANRVMPNPPKIVAHKGTYYNGRYLSYQCDDGIFLARNQRELLTLVHELVHAMGYDYHDKKFVRVYLRRLCKLFDLNKQEIYRAARNYKVAF